MKVFCKRLMVFILLVATICAGEITKAQCLACELIEKDGDASLNEIKKLRYDEFLKNSAQGETPFYWSVLQGANQVRDFLIQTVQKEDLISGKKVSDLYTACAMNSRCPVENFDVLHKLGFGISKQGLSAAVTGPQECSINKFQKLIDLGAALNGRDQNNFNLLHQIVDRSRKGRPVLDRDCLVSAIELLSQRNPELKRQKNRDGYTPKELAQFYRKNKEEWGSGVKRADIDEIIKALR